jgi:hypothetical protein
MSIFQKAFKEDVVVVSAGTSWKNFLNNNKRCAFKRRSFCTSSSDVFIKGTDTIDPGEGLKEGEEVLRSCQNALNGTFV